MQIGMILHILAFLFGILHWYFTWGICVSKDGGNNCESSDERLYSWCLILGSLIFLGAFIVNIAVEAKKNTGKITSILAIVGAVLFLYYALAWWIGDQAKVIREAKDIELLGLELKFLFKLGRILYWPAMICGLAGGAFPAVFDGLK